MGHAVPQDLQEANGDLILPLWKILTAVFHLGKRKKYAFEGIRLMSDLYFRLSEFHAHILLWNRWSNRTGLSDGNKPLDLRIEHLNRILRKLLRRLGSNLRQETVIKVTKAAPVLDLISKPTPEAINLHPQKNGQIEKMM